MRCQRSIREAPTVIGRSRWARKTREEIATVAPSTSTVLVLGPTGTGKELIARSIHSESGRHSQPFVPVDCASISGPLCSSQLFGHVKGAFTGADYESLGCFRAADGGTIFLDEIGELDLQNQAMLLRVLQERVVTPVGSHQEIPINVRVIAATNRDLKEETQAGQFRIDLLYRLNVVTLQTVPLSQRGEDIPILAEHFLTKLAEENGFPQKELSIDALSRLCDSAWPGNVRELQNVLERSAVYSDNEIIQTDSLRLPADANQDVPNAQPLASQSSSDSATNAAKVTEDVFDSWPTLSQLEAEHIARTLEAVGYNKSAAARLLDIDRHVLARKIKKYNLQKPLGLN